MLARISRMHLRDGLSIREVSRRTVRSRITVGQFFDFRWSMGGMQT